MRHEFVCVTDGLDEYNLVYRKFLWSNFKY